MRLITLFMALGFSLSVRAESAGKAEESDWLYYSYGLELKLRSLKNPESEENAANIRKALEYFRQAERSGRALDLVYAHIADCLYFLGDFRGALIYGEKSADCNPKYIAPYIRIFTAHIRLKDAKAAASALERCIAENPDAVYPTFLLAEHYLTELNDYQRAETCFLSVIKTGEQQQTDPHYLESSYYYLGVIALKRNNFADALRCYEKAFEINGRSLRAAYMLALLYMEVYDLEKAARFAGMYLAGYPNTPDMMSVMGRILYIMDEPGALSYLRGGSKSTMLSGMIAKGLAQQLDGRNEEAKITIKQLAAYNANILSCRLAMAKIYADENYREGQINELVSGGIIAYNAGLSEVSKRCFLSALLLDSSLPDACVYLGRLCEDEGSYSKALVYYKTANNLKPDTDISVRIGYVHVMNKNYKEAERCFDAVTAGEPENDYGWFGKGLVSFYGKDYASAEKYFRHAIELNGRQEHYGYYLVMTLDKSGKSSDAIEYLEQALLQNPDSPEFSNYLGYMYAEANINLDRSLLLIQKALEKEPKNGAYLDSLGWVYYRKGMLSEALEALLKAEQELDIKEEADPTVYDHIGDVYNSIGNREQAQRYWEKSLALEENANVRKKLGGLPK